MCAGAGGASVVGKGTRVGGVHQSEAHRPSAVVEVGHAFWLERNAERVDGTRPNGGCTAAYRLRSHQVQCTLLVGVTPASPIVRTPRNHGRASPLRLCSSRSPNDVNEAQAADPRP